MYARALIVACRYLRPDIVILLTLPGYEPAAVILELSEVWPGALCPAAKHLDELQNIFADAIDGGTSIVEVGLRGGLEDEHACVNSVEEVIGSRTE